MFYSLMAIEKAHKSKPIADIILLTMKHLAQLLRSRYKLLIQWYHLTTNSNCKSIIAPQVISNLYNNGSNYVRKKPSFQIDQET